MIRGLEVPKGERRRAISTNLRASSKPLQIYVVFLSTTVFSFLEAFSLDVLPHLSPLSASLKILLYPQSDTIVYEYLNLSESAERTYDPASCVKRRIYKYTLVYYKLYEATE
jgi:hypothetical protein